MTDAQVPKEQDSQSTTSEAPLAAPSGGSSPAPMPKDQVIALSLSGAGFALSLLLEQLHVQTHTVPNAEHFCSVDSTFDCAAVAASPYALFLGLPWAVWGALGFLALGIASYQRSKWSLPLAGVAAAVSIGLLIVSLVVIGSVCLLCEGVHLISIALFVVIYRSRQTLQGDLKEWTKAAAILGVPAGLAVIALVTIPAYWNAFSYKSEPPFPTGKTEEGHYWIGSESPTVTIVEYVNYRCPFCKIGTARLLRELGKKSEWRLIRRPLEPGGCPHDSPMICRASRLAYCAGEQGKFWRADRWLFSHEEGEDRFNKDAMIQDLDLDRGAFDVCYVSEAAFAYNDNTYNEARAKGLSGVPSYEIQSAGPIPEELKPLQQMGVHLRSKSLRDLAKTTK